VLAAGCGFVNCIPVFIARERYWQQRFEKKGLPVIGDDIKSQVGATITHRVLARLFVDRGVRIDRTYQLNFGGNTDFLNMLERERLESKKISKTGAVTSLIPYKLGDDNVHVGPSDYVPWLLDRKWCHIRMEGTTFGDVPLNLEMKLEVWDSPNSAGVVIDAVRCCKLALDHGLKGALIAPSSYFKKSPPQQFPDDVAHAMVEDYIRTYGHKKEAAGAGKAGRAKPAAGAGKAAKAKPAARRGRSLRRAASKRRG
jgi:myo-inositol-1-phosphate synthase